MTKKAVTVAILVSLTAVAAVFILLFPFSDGNPDGVREDRFIVSAEAWEMVRSGGDALILDLQDAEGYHRRHISGAVNIPLDRLAEYAGSSLPDKDRPIICYCFCGGDGGSSADAYELLSGLGYVNVYRTEPGDEWYYEGVLASSPQSADGGVCAVISGAEAMDIFDGNGDALLLDVRNPDEYAEKHIEGSVLLPVSELEGRLGELSDKNAVIIVYCRAGRRSAEACGILKSNGYKNVYDMQTVDNWPLPLVSGE